MNTNYYLITKDSNIHTHNLEEDIKAFEGALNDLSEFELTIFKKQLIDEFGKNTYLYDSITKYQIVFFLNDMGNNEEVKNSEYYKTQIKNFCKKFKLREHLKKLKFEKNEIDILLQYTQKREKIDKLDKLYDEVNGKEYNTNYLVEKYFEDNKNKDFEDIYYKWSQDLKFHYIQNSYGEGYGSTGEGKEYSIDKLKKDHTWLYNSLKNNSNYALSMPFSCIHDFNMSKGCKEWSNLINRDDRSEGINKELYTRYDSSKNYKKNEEFTLTHSGLQSFDFKKKYKKKYNFYEIKEYKTKLKLKSGYEYYDELKRFDSNNDEHYSYFYSQYGHQTTSSRPLFTLINDNGYFSNITGTNEIKKRLYVRPNRTDRIKYEFKTPLPVIKRDDEEVEHKDFANFKIYKEGNLLTLYSGIIDKLPFRNFKYSNNERDELDTKLISGMIKSLFRTPKKVYNELITTLTPTPSITLGNRYPREGDTYKDAIRNMETLIDKNYFKKKTDLVKKHFKEFYFNTSDYFDKNDYLLGVDSKRTFNIKLMCLCLIQYMCTSSVYSNFKKKLFESCNLAYDHEEFEKFCKLKKVHNLQMVLINMSTIKPRDPKYKEILKKLIDESKKEILPDYNNLDMRNNNLDMNNIIIFYLKKSINDINNYYKKTSETDDFNNMIKKFEANNLTYAKLKNYDKQTGGNINKHYLNLETNETDEEQTGGNVNTNYLNLENDMTTEMTGGFLNSFKKKKLSEPFYNTMDKDQFETLKENQYIVKITNEEDWLQLNDKDLFVEKANAELIDRFKIEFLDNNLFYESKLFKKTKIKHKNEDINIDIWKIETLESNDKLINETDKFNLGNINIIQFLDSIKLTLNSKDKNKNDKVNYLFYFIKCYGITPLIRKEVFDGILEKQSSDFKLDIFLNNKSNDITNFSVLIPYLQFEILKIINENNFFNIDDEQYKHLNFQSIFFDYNIIEEDRLNLKSLRTFKTFVKKLIKNS